MVLTTLLHFPSCPATGSQFPQPRMAFCVYPSPTDHFEGIKESPVCFSNLPNPRHYSSADTGIITTVMFSDETKAQTLLVTDPRSPPTGWGRRWEWNRGGCPPRPSASIRPRCPAGLPPAVLIEYHVLLHFLPETEHQLPLPPPPQPAGCTSVVGEAMLG